MHGLYLACMQFLLYLGSECMHVIYGTRFATAKLAHTNEIDNQQADNDIQECTHPACTLRNINIHCNSTQHNYYSLLKYYHTQHVMSVLRTSE